MIWQLNQWEWVDLSAQPAQGDPAPERRRRKAGAHIGERWRCGDRPRDPNPHIGFLVAVESDPVAPEQPIAEARLPLAKKLEIEVPDAFGGLNEHMGALLAPRH